MASRRLTTCASPSITAPTPSPPTRARSCTPIANCATWPRNAGAAFCSNPPSSMACRFFSLFHENLPVVHLQGFRGVLNSTTNVILDGMESGLEFEAALQKAQEIGVAETDATLDIEGWDAAVKVAALVTVLMDGNIRLSEIERQGIGKLSAGQVRAARAQGRPYKLVCSARRTSSAFSRPTGPTPPALSRASRPSRFRGTIPWHG